MVFVVDWENIQIQAPVLWRLLFIILFFLPTMLNFLFIYFYNPNNKNKMIRTARMCVSPMYPDKMCDRISDTLLDFHLNQDPNSRCVIEVCGGNGKVFVTGEVTSTSKVTEDDIKNIVYIISGVEDVIIHLNQQSPEIVFKELILVEKETKEL